MKPEIKKPSKRNMYVFGFTLLFTFLIASVFSFISPLSINNLWYLVLLQAICFIAAALDFDLQRIKFFLFKEIADLKKRVDELEKEKKTK